MLTEPLPWPPLFLLRQALFLLPLAAAVLLFLRPLPARMRIGAIFAFLYALPMVFLCHVAAVATGAWRFGGDTLMLLGVPADIWFGGALLFGPVLYLAFPSTSPGLLVLPSLALNGLLLPALTPLVTVGRPWFLATALVFLVAHLPALALARWTAEGRHLPWRAALLALGYGPLAFFLLPSLVMHAMGGGWEPLASRPTWVLLLGAAALGACFVLGLTAVQLFALHGGGTPIPLDPTQRLVRCGIYAYLANPMQTATAAAWLVLGAVLGNPWVAAAAGMAVCFVLGMVRWHHRHDLEQRFPDGWPVYRAHVPEWWPRWRPWLPETVVLQHDPERAGHRALLRLLARLDARGLDLRAGSGALCYREPGEPRDFVGAAAVAKLLNHGNLATALLGAGLLLAALPIQAVRSRHA